MGWTTDNARELREFLGKDAGKNLVEMARIYSDEVLGKGSGFEEVSLSSKEAKGRKDMLTFIKEKSEFEEQGSVTSPYVDLSE